MTAIVGVLCRDGVVIGTDGSATFGDRTPTIEQQTRKLDVLGQRLIYAGAGSIGHSQRFVRQLDHALAGDDFEQPHPIETATKLSRRVVSDLASTGTPFPVQLGALVAFEHRGMPQLCEFYAGDLQPELKTEHLWYASMGIAQPITDPFLALMREIFWTNGPPALNEGVFAVTWTLQHTIAVNPGGVGPPMNVAVLERREPNGPYQARKLDESELDEHRENVEEAKQHLRNFRDRHRPENAPDLPRP